MRVPRFGRQLVAIAVLGCAILLAGLPVAKAADKRLAVLEFQGRKIDDETLITLADAVRGGALEGVAGRGVDVMTRERPRPN